MPPYPTPDPGNRIMSLPQPEAPLAAFHLRFNTPYELGQTAAWGAVESAEHQTHRVQSWT
jgi:hypothetical protein